MVAHTVRQQPARTPATVLVVIRLTVTLKNAAVAGFRGPFVQLVLNILAIIALRRTIAAFDCGPDRAPYLIGNFRRLGLYGVSDWR